MQSLAIIATIVTLSIVGTGLLAAALTLSGWRAAGAAVGVAAIASGLWLGATLPHARMLWAVPIAVGAWTVWRWMDAT